MKYRLMRLSAAFLPAALLAAHFLGAGAVADDIFLIYLLLQLFACCPAEAYRNAAAREPGIRRADKRFGAAVSQLIIGCLIAGGIIFWMSFNRPVEYGAVNSFDPLTLIPLFGTAALIIFEQMFEERLYAVGRAADGTILAALSNGLLLTGMLLEETNGGYRMLYCLSAAGLGALIGLIFTLTAQPFRSFSLIPRNYGFVPKAFAQFMLYPAACGAVSICLYELSLESVAAGWLLWRLSRSYARRTRNESLPLNLLLIAVCAVLIIGTEFCQPLNGYALAALLALICADIVYLAPSARLYAGTILLMAAAVIFGRIPGAYYICIALCLAALALNLKRIPRIK